MAVFSGWLTVNWWIQAFNWVLSKLYTIYIITVKVCTVFVLVYIPQRRWRPYPPEVTQHLERAHSKKLRSVILGDSDPSLKNYCINLPQMEQECKTTGENWIICEKCKSANKITCSDFAVCRSAQYSTGKCPYKRKEQ